MVCREWILRDVAADNWVTINKQGPIRENVAGSGLRGPAWVEASAALPEVPSLEINFRIAVVNRVYEVVELRVSASNSAAVTSEVLRGIPVRTLVREALNRHILPSLNMSLRVLPGTFDETPEMRVVASCYRLARLVGDAPTEAVARRLNVSRATAGRRIAAARDAGLLGVDEVGSGGGAHSRLGG
jgi:hypothetical protein